MAEEENTESKNTEGQNTEGQNTFNVLKKTQDVAGGKASDTVPKVDGVEINPDAAGTNLTETDKELNNMSNIDPKTVDNVPIVNAPKKPDPNVGMIEGIETTSDKLKDAQAAQGEVTYVIDDITGTLSEGAMAEGITEELNPKATVRYQLSELMATIKDGSPPPAWAAGAVRKVASLMNSRGLGGSSMAASAMISAIMEAGVPIAAADAQAHSKIQLQNLNNKQQAALQNAVTVASMDKANLNARLTSAVNNAQNFLKMDIQNLTNKQASDTLTYQAFLKGAFTDAAEENARKQFNAKNQIQIEEYFAELGVQVETANANRVAAMDQYNTSEENAMMQYNQSMRDSREKFNKNMSFAIDQSNVQWRRDVNTANTAIQNETNRINVQNQYNASQQAMNQLWQKYRDNASYNFQSLENSNNREHQIGMMALEFAYNMQLLSKEKKDRLFQLIGSFISGWGDNS
tara:strand:- start:9918 stop:11300 length:1383 start_codon:yes stop_codon:yes gene_type:complete